MAKGMEKDFAKGAEWLTKAALQGMLLHNTTWAACISGVKV